MGWTIEYFEQENTAQPAELFEDELDQAYPQLAGKLIRITDLLEVEGFHLGGGLIEKCHNYQGLWEMRAIYAGTLAREFFGFDGERIVLLHGYVKRIGQPASDRELEKAFHYWREYQRTRCISPMQEEDTNE
jgi:hypothetical protein